MTEINKRLKKAIESTVKDSGEVDFLFKWYKKMPHKHKVSYIHVKRELAAKEMKEGCGKAPKGKYADWLWRAKPEKNCKKGTHGSSSR